MDINTCLTLLEAEENGDKVCKVSLKWRLPPEPTWMASAAHYLPAHSLSWKWELSGSVELEFPADGGGCCPAVTLKSHRAQAPCLGSAEINLLLKIWHPGTTIWLPPHSGFGTRISLSGVFFSCFAWVLTVEAELT